MPNETLEQPAAESVPDTVVHAPKLSNPIEKVGPYIIVREIGRGAMGAVYLAEHENLGRKVALKILPPELAIKGDRLKRFEREMAAIGRLEHENVVLATDAGNADGYSFIAMQFIDGMDLDRLLLRSNRLDVDAACEVIRQAAMGLQHLYENELVHRDIKASNIAVTNDGVVKLLDLGIARLRRENESASSLTSDESMMGTPDFMAPEQIQGFKDVDIRADIYSLGCTLYKLLCGNAPFEGPDYGTSTAKLMAHVSRKPRPLKDYCPELPSELIDFVDRMMAKSPADRPPTPADVAQNMSQWADKSSLLNCIDGKPTKKTRILPKPAAATPQQKPAAPSLDDEKPSGPKRKLIAGFGLGGLLILAAMVAPKIFGGGDKSPSKNAVVTSENVSSSDNAVVTNTQRIADSNTAIAINTKHIARSLDALRTQFQTISSSETAISKPKTPADFYHNANVYSAKGDYRSARKSFLEYFQNDLGVVDPHLRFSGFLKLQEGLAGAREVYANLPGDRASAARRFAEAMLQEPDSRQSALQSIVADFPKFAPAYLELSKTYAQGGAAKQSLRAKKQERDYLRTFVELHEQGHLVRHYLDQSQAIASIEAAQKRLNSDWVTDSMIENPLTVTLVPMGDSKTCMAVVRVEEPCIGISYRIGESGEYRSTGTPPYAQIDRRTGKKYPDTSFEFEAQSATTIYLKYIDGSGEEQGPFEEKYNPEQALIDDALMHLKDDPQSWLRLHKDGLLFFDLLGHWRGLSEVRYGVGVETPNLVRPIPTVDYFDAVGREFAGINVPPSTPFISIQVTYIDGTKSEVVKIKRQNR